MEKDQKSDRGGKEAKTGQTAKQSASSGSTKKSSAEKDERKLNTGGRRKE